MNTIANPQSHVNDGLLSAALDYAGRGFSVIPTRGKQARFPWKRDQSERPHPDLVRDWFGGRFADIDGVAVVCGPVSGGLTIRDYDDGDVYDRWAAAHPDLAATLPTVATSRGYHVYCRAELSRIRKVEKGELRGAGYCLLPPSRHPSGTAYRWTVPLSDGPLPIIDPRVAGLLSHDTQDTQDTQHSLHVSDSSDATIETIIARTLPTGPGQRNRRLFDLARVLKAVIPNASRHDLRGIVQTWHRHALRFIRTKDFTTSWTDFTIARAAVKVPHGATLAELVKQAEGAHYRPLPWPTTCPPCNGWSRSVPHSSAPRAGSILAALLPDRRRRDWRQSRHGRAG